MRMLNASPFIGIGKQEHSITKVRIGAASYLLMRFMSRQLHL